MAMYEPLCLPPNADEQDFVQAYENVREKYKGITDWEIGVTGSDDMNVCVFAGAHTLSVSLSLEFGDVQCVFAGATCSRASAVGV